MIVTEEFMNFWERNGYNDKNNTEKQGTAYYNDEFGNTSTSAYAKSSGVFGGEKGENAGKNGANLNIEDEMRRFSGMSNDELMSELMAKTAASRANGTLNVQELEKFYSVATMFMNTEQLTRLRALLNMLEK